MPRTVIVVLLAVLSCTACEAPECAQMRQCCAAIEGEEWVGDACGALAQDLDRGSSCAAVIEAIRVAAEQRKSTVPAVCQ